MRLATLISGAVLGVALWGVAPTIDALHSQAQARTKVKTPPGSITEGRRTWLKLNCYGCHGMDASGGMGPNVQHAESGDLSEAVMSGEDDGGMPSFRKYATSTDVANLYAYLHSIGTASEPTWVDWWNTNP